MAGWAKHFREIPSERKRGYLRRFPPTLPEAPPIPSSLKNMPNIGLRGQPPCKPRRRESRRRRQANPKTKHTRQRSPGEQGYEKHPLQDTSNPRRQPSKLCTGNAGGKPSQSSSSDKTTRKVEGPQATASPLTPSSLRGGRRRIAPAWRLNGGSRSTLQVS